MLTRLALALASGLLLAAIHPGLNLYWLAPVALAPLLLAVRDVERVRDRFLLGWASGFVYWASMCYWIQGTLNRHGGLDFAGASGVFLLFALAKGLHSAVFATLARGAWVAPLLWVGLERTHGPLGFPWLTLGDAGLDSALAWIAPWTGVYGLSLVFAATSAMLARRQWWAALVWVAFLLPPSPMGAGREKALAVQPAFDEAAPPRDPQRVLFEMSRTAEPVRLILWPEMPVGLYFQHDAALRMRVSELAVASKAGVIAGTVAFQSLTQPLNSAQFIDANGQAVGRYDKMNLVPFGEYVPWPFNAIVEKVSTEAGTFSGGSRLIAPLINGHRAGTFICYESAFPHHARAFVAGQGAEVLVNLTNDGYFARSAARGQHLALARMRALENGRWLLRPTNDGFTASIDPRGRLHDAAPPYVPRAVTLGFEYVSAKTFYTATGDWLAWSALVAGFAIAAAGRFRAARG